MNLFVFEAKDIKVAKAFLSYGNGEMVNFKVTKGNISMSTISSSHRSVCSMAVETSVENGDDEVRFALRRDAFAKALSLFDVLILSHSEGSVTLSSTTQSISLYKTPDYTTPHAFDFVEFEEFIPLSQSTVRKLTDVFSITAVPNVYSMKTLQLGRKSSFVTKIHYVEASIPELKLLPDVNVAVEIVPIMKHMVNSLDLSKTLEVSWTDTEFFLTIKDNSEESKIHSQVRFPIVYEESMWKREEVDSQKDEFKVVVNSTSTNNISSTLEVFRIALYGKEAYEVELAVENNKLSLVVYDIGNQPTIVNIPAQVEQGTKGMCKVTYQSLMDIFSRGHSTYAITSKESILAIETSDTLDIITKYI